MPRKRRAASILRRMTLPDAEGRKAGGRFRRRAARTFYLKNPLTQPSDFATMQAAMEMDRLNVDNTENQEPVPEAGTRAYPAPLPPADGAGSFCWEDGR